MIRQNKRSLLVRKDFLFGNTEFYSNRTILEKGKKLSLCDSLGKYHHEETYLKLIYAANRILS